MSRADVSNSTPAPAVRAPSHSILNRRSLLTGAAVVAIAAAPVAAQAALADQELVELGRRYEAALTTEDAALAAWDAAGEAYAAAEPAMPNELRHRVWEHAAWLFPLSPQTRAISDLDTGDFYNTEEIDRLRGMRHVTRVGVIRDKATGAERDAGAGAEAEFNEVREEKFVRHVPNPEAQARADEILGAWDRHEAACETLPAYHACLDAEVRYYTTVRARRALADEIIAARATTLAGLAVRARIVAGMIDADDDTDVHVLDDRLMMAIVRDLAAMPISA